MVGSYATAPPPPEVWERFHDDGDGATQAAGGSRRLPTSELEREGAEEEEEQAEEDGGDGREGGREGVHEERQPLRGATDE